MQDCSQIILRIPYRHHMTLICDFEVIFHFKIILGHLPHIKPKLGLGRGRGIFFLGPRWSDLQNSKGVHLVLVTDEETMWVHTMTNSRLVTI